MSDNRFIWEPGQATVTWPAEESDTLAELQAEIDRIEHVLATATVIPDPVGDAFNPNQPRDSAGKWTSGGGGGIGGGSEQRGSPELRAMLSNGTATKEALLSEPSFMAAAHEVESAPLNQNKPGYGTQEYFDSRSYDGKSLDEAVDYLYDQSGTLAYKNPEDALPIKQEFQATIFTGAPASGKSTVAEPHAMAMQARIIDSDEAKKLIPEFNGGKGAAAVHEESRSLIEPVYERAISRGDNIVIPKVGHTAASIDREVRYLQSRGYTVKVALVDTTPQTAWQRMAGRWVATGRLIPPSYMQHAVTAPAKAYEQMVFGGVANSYARIDNNPGMGQPRIMIAGEVAGF